MKTFMCGDTGRLNRGCEAIVRGTSEVLGAKDLCIATFAPEQNRPMAREIGVQMLSYAGYKTSIHRYFCAIMRKLSKKSLCGFFHIQRNLFKEMTKDDMCLNIGGDTYCYKRPCISLALNRYTTKKKIKTILWCCSIEKNKIQGEIFKDLKRYDYIFAREPITVKNLLDQGIPKEKVVKVCDPAFFLKTKEVPLPESFIVGNTVGINLSDCVVYGKYKAAYENTKVLIDWILKETDMSICLIPHVYSINDEYNHDYPILKRLYKEINNERVSLIDKEYDCEQLKYIISKCKYFLGARTHSTIAAYSSKIPTLVIGYSVKSKGIAEELFGTYENYVLPFDDLKNDDEILNAFKLLIHNEDAIKQRYEEFLPIYKQQLLNAVEKYVKIQKKNLICDKKDCSGCYACASACPKQCITMEQNKEGFDYPIINYEQCINCKKCSDVCPVINKIKDDNAHPTAYGAINKNNLSRKEGSSGGIFGLLAKYVLDLGGVVIAPTFNEKFQLSHTIIDNESDLHNAIGSKYIQSRVGETYKNAKTLLDKGKIVMFSGTPCQIAGLKVYLGVDYENLITQDVVCHGVPSPLSWLYYLQGKAKKAKANCVTKVKFRQKADDNQTKIALSFDNGSEYSQSYTNDSFIKSYLSNINLRLSCYRCSFKQQHRCADITLGDFWGVEQVAPELNDNKGVSLVLLHSEKGKEIFEKIKENILHEQVDYTKAISANRAYLISSPQNPLRKAFYKKINSKNFDKTVTRFCGNGYVSKTIRFIKKIIG